MIILIWRLSVVVNAYLQFYMPTNRAVAWLRTPRGLKWAIPVGVVATPTYVGLMALAVEGATRPGLGWFNLLVVLFYWNAMKFAWLVVLVVLTFPVRLGRQIRKRCRKSCTAALTQDAVVDPFRV